MLGTVRCCLKFAAFCANNLFFEFFSLSTERLSDELSSSEYDFNSETRLKHNVCVSITKRHFFVSFHYLCCAMQYFIFFFDTTPWRNKKRDLFGKVELSGIKYTYSCGCSKSRALDMIELF